MEEQWTLAISGRQLRVSLYGDAENTPMVLLPALGVADPKEYFEPLAERLKDRFLVAVVEPFGYGQSDQTSDSRAAENVAEEIKAVLDGLRFPKYVLLCHSVAGIYGLHFAHKYPERLLGIVGVETSIYSDVLALEMETERERMLQAVRMSGNETLVHEVETLGENLKSIRGMQYPETLPVLLLLSEENTVQMPGWREGHLAQLHSGLECQKLWTLHGSHVLWQESGAALVQKIEDWFDRVKAL